MFGSASAAASGVSTSLQLMSYARGVLRETIAKTFGVTSSSLRSCLVLSFRLTQSLACLGGEQSLEEKVHFNPNLLPSLVD